MSENEDTIMRDCFGYSRTKNACTGLEELICKTRKCPFYKPAKLLWEQREQAKVRNEERCSF